MNSQPIKPYRSYMLHYGLEPTLVPNQPPVRIFIVEGASGQRRRWEFCTFEQVMNFLLDELLGQPEEAQDMRND